MVTDRDLAFTPAYELRDLVRKREVSPVELTENALRRIEALDPQLNSFLTVTPELALAAARKAEEALTRGEPLGPLHGIPTSIKDLVPTRGVRTTRGLTLFEDWVPDEDDIVVERIKASGAIILGKTNVPELGQSGTTQNLLGDDCRNPWDPERVAGGSSGGASASVAAGMTPVAQGSDGGGSIRIPASFCGNYGIKGTPGRVPSVGGGPMTWLPGLRFSVISPVTRTVRDAAIMLQLMAGPHPDDPLSEQLGTPDLAAGLESGVRGMRVGWSPDLGSAAVDPEVLEVTGRAAQAFEEMGAHLEPAPFELDVVELFRIFTTVHHVILYLGLGELYEEHGGTMMPPLRTKFERGKELSGREFLSSLAELERYRRYVADYFSTYDLLLTPTLCVPAFPCGEWPQAIGGQALDPLSVSEDAGWYHFTYPFNISGNPAASVPCGFSSDGLPVGLQIVGRRGQEATVLQASAAFEEARPWADKRPPVSRERRVG